MELCTTFLINLNKIKFRVQKMKSNICGILSKQELKKLLKMEIRFTARCYSCPLNDLAAKNRMSCVRIIQCICGKSPNKCSEAIKLLRNFLGKFEQNKI